MFPLFVVIVVAVVVSAVVEEQHYLPHSTKGLLVFYRIIVDSERKAQ